MQSCKVLQKPQYLGLKYIIYIRHKIRGLSANDSKQLRSKILFPIT